MMRVLTDYHAIRSNLERSPESVERISQSQRILVYSLREHLDDCQMVLMCLVDPTAFKGIARDPDRFLKAANLPEAKVFWNGVNSYAAEYVMPLVNALKHSQERFRTLICECSAADIRPGFYLEEVNEEGVAQPSVNLHRGDSAFSFARDIRNNLAMIFKAAEALKAALTKALTRLNVKVLEKPEGAELVPGTWLKVCKQVAALDSGVFPQELKRRFVRFTYSDEKGLRIRELERDHTLSFPTTKTRCEIQTLGDGMTKTFRLPFVRRWPNTASEL